MKKNTKVLFQPYCCIFFMVKAWRYIFSGTTFLTQPEILIPILDLTKGFGKLFKIKIFCKDQLLHLAVSQVKNYINITKIILTKLVK